MTSMNRDTDYANMAQSIRFAIRQSLKDLYTCMPGIVESYDAETRRAVVKGALKVVTTNKEEIEREAIHNVPVVFPSGGGFAMTFPLEPGDAVLLLYSQRGLTNWKKTLGVAAPDIIGFFSEKDAFAIPGFGPTQGELEHIIAVDSQGVKVSSTTAVAVEAPTVTVRTDFGESVVISVGASGIRIETAGTVTIEAADVTFKRAGSSAAPESIITHIHPEYESHTHPE